MRKISISELDRKVNEGRPICLDIAMNRVYRHIVESIDPTLPDREFKTWYKDGADKPLRWNKINYYWGE